MEVSNGKRQQEDIEKLGGLMKDVFVFKRDNLTFKECYTYLVQYFGNVSSIKPVMETSRCEGLAQELSKGTHVEYSALEGKYAILTTDLALVGVLGWENGALHCVQKAEKALFVRTGVDRWCCQELLSVLFSKEESFVLMSQIALAPLPVDFESSTVFKYDEVGDTYTVITENPFILKYCDVLLAEVD